MHLQNHLGSLALVRLLQEWAPAPAEPSRQDTAERLGDWLSPVASVQLDGALQAIASYGVARERKAGGPGGVPVDATALDVFCRHAKKELTDMIAAKLALTATDIVAGAEGQEGGGGDYAPHFQRYVELQKQMDCKIAACRAHVRQAMAQGAPALRQLAALDQVMAGMLGEREQRLLAALPVYLERRFAHWRRAGGDDGSQGWLRGFQEDMRRMLLAELQARFQPVLGLIEAVRATQQQASASGRDGQMDRHGHPA